MVGVAVEFDEDSRGSSTDTTIPRIPLTLGMNIELFCTAMTWNGSSAESFVFCESPLKVVVGQSNVSLGLDIALLQMSTGDVANVICSPAKAYGEAGLPPLVPSNSNVVYRISDIKILDTSSVPPVVQVPPELIVGR